MFSVKLFTPAFTTTVGDTPVTFEPRDGKWLATCGWAGVVEIWGTIREDVQHIVQAIYGRPVHLHQRAS